MVAVVIVVLVLFFFFVIVVLSCKEVVWRYWAIYKEKMGHGFFKFFKAHSMRVYILFDMGSHLRDKREILRIRAGHYTAENRNLLFSPEAEVVREAKGGLWVEEE